jgi:hypothetical protein
MARSSIVSAPLRLDKRARAPALTSCGTVPEALQRLRLQGFCQAARAHICTWRGRRGRGDAQVAGCAGGGLPPVRLRSKGFPLSGARQEIATVLGEAFAGILSCATRRGARQVRGGSGSGPIFAVRPHLRGRIVPTTPCADGAGWDLPDREDAPRKRGRKRGRRQHGPARRPVGRRNQKGFMMRMPYWRGAPASRIGDSRAET